MEWWLAILLGILQGVTEWLPVSSSGHLAIFQYYFGAEPPILFDIILHLGSLCVILYVMREELRQLVVAFTRFIVDYQSWHNLRGNKRILAMIIVASFPTAVIGFTFDSTIIGDFYSEMYLVGSCLIFTGLLIWFSKDCDGDKKTDDFPLLHTLVVCFFQGLAILPGVSRSGSTIAISKFLGMDSVKAARFSFLLFIPAIIGFAATMITISSIRTLIEINNKFI